MRSAPVVELSQFGRIVFEGVYEQREEGWVVIDWIFGDIVLNLMHEHMRILYPISEDDEEVVNEY